MNETELRELLSVPHSGYTKTFLQNMFAVKDGKSSKFEPNTKITLSKKLLEETKNPILKFLNAKDIIDTETTVGRYVVNFFLFAVRISAKIEWEMTTRKGRKIKTTTVGIELSDTLLLEKINYRNETLNSKKVGEINRDIADLYIDEDINAADLTDYIDRLQWMGYSCAFFLEPSLDLKTIQPNAKITAFKNKTIKDNSEVIDQNKILEFGGSVEKPVLDFAGKELDDIGATGKIIYDSGYNGSFSNNYKNTSLFRGVSPKSSDPSSYSISMSNLTDGVQKKEGDLLTMYDLVVTGNLGRAIDTRMGGYKTKIFNAAFASLMLDNPGTDCGSTLYYKVKIDNDNWKDFKFRYYNENGKLKIITKQNLKEVSGKELKLRSPLYCKSKLICSKCAGELYYKLKVRNIGLMTNNISATLMNSSMKAFHDLSLKPSTYNLEEFISESKV